jgi:hypothetical protein
MIVAFMLLFTEPTISPRGDEYVFRHVVNKNFKTYAACHKHVEEMQFFKEGKHGSYVIVNNKENQVALTTCIEKK